MSLPAWTGKPTPWIEFGPGALSKIGDLAGLYAGERIVAVVDANVAPRVTPVIEEELGARLADIVSYDLPGEPTIAALDRFAAHARSIGADSVVGVGGGSAMDTAKGVAVLLTNPGSGAQYQGLGLLRSFGAPLILVPTTAGSGSEATWTAVFINEELGFKRGINGPQVFACGAILDPELTLGLPPRQTAVSGMDALIHAIESFAAGNATELSRMFSRQALGLIFSALPRAVQEPGDLEARSNMLLGSFFAGAAIANAEVGLSHALSYPLGVRYGVPHGLGNALLIAATSSFNAETCPEVYEEIRSYAGAAQRQGESVGRFMADYVDALGISGSLSDFGVKVDDIDALAEEALRLRGPLDNHRRPVAAADARALYEAVL